MMAVALWKGGILLLCYHIISKSIFCWQNQIHYIPVPTEIDEEFKMATISYYQLPEKQKCKTNILLYNWWGIWGPVVLTNLSPTFCTYRHKWNALKPAQLANLSWQQCQNPDKHNIVQLWQSALLHYRMKHNTWAQWNKIGVMAAAV